MKTIFTLLLVAIFSLSCTDKKDEKKIEATIQKIDSLEQNVKKDIQDLKELTNKVEKDLEALDNI